MGWEAVGSAVDDLAPVFYEGLNLALWQTSRHSVIACSHLFCKDSSSSAQTCEVCGRQHLRDLWELQKICSKKSFSQVVRRVSEGASACVADAAPPSCKAFPGLQGRQQSRGAA